MSDRSGVYARIAQGVNPLTQLQNLTNLQTSRFNLQQSQLAPALSGLMALRLKGNAVSDDDVAQSFAGSARIGGNTDGLSADYAAFRAAGGSPSDFVQQYSIRGMPQWEQFQAVTPQRGAEQTAAGTYYGTFGAPGGATPGVFTPSGFTARGFSPTEALEPRVVMRPDANGNMVPTVVPQGTLGGDQGFSGGGGGGGPGSGGGVPASVASNNFGNIRQGSGFASYNTPQEGIAAMASQLGINQTQHGLNTLRAQLHRWAPYGDGNNNPDAYAAIVGKATGLHPDAAVDFTDPSVLSKVIPAMARVEHGAPMGVSPDVLNQGIQLAGGGGGGGRLPPGSYQVASNAPVPPPSRGGGNVLPAGGGGMTYLPPSPGGTGVGQGWSYPPPGLIESRQATAAASTKQYTDDMTAAGQFNQRMWPLVNAQHILETQGTTTGPGAAAARDIIGHLQTLSSVFTPADLQTIGQAKFEELNKYLTQAVNAQPFAQASDARLASAITGNPSAHISTMANTDILKAMIGLERMKQMAITDFNNQGGEPMGYAQFQRNWQMTHDPRAFVFDMLNNDQRQKLVDSMKSPTERTNFGNTLTLIQNNPSILTRAAMP